jgi:hypothetical protein
MNTVMMPKELTAENGAKYAFTGEFKVKQLMHCDYEDCDDGINNGQICEACDGAGEYMLAIDIPWTTIKEIYAKAVELLGQQVDLEEEFQKAFMHGQIDCGVDPSYSAAQKYAEAILRQI